MIGLFSANPAGSARENLWIYFLIFSFHLANKARATSAAPRRIRVETSGIWHLIIVSGKKIPLVKVIVSLCWEFNEWNSLSGPQSANGLCRRSVFALTPSSVPH